MGAAGVPMTLSWASLPFPAVKGEVEVLMDGGVRRGSDIVKALCLGVIPHERGKGPHPQFGTGSVRD